MGRGTSECKGPGVGPGDKGCVADEVGDGKESRSQALKAVVRKESYSRCNGKPLEYSGQGSGSI